MKQPLQHIPAEYIRECFYTDGLGNLFWKERPRAHFSSHSGYRVFAAKLRLRNGESIGRLNSQGYPMVTLTLKGRSYKILNHRIIWLLTHGDWPTQYIDHINRVRSDNRPENLRDVSHAENMRNTDRAKRDGTGLVGAYRSKNGRRFRSQIQTGAGIKHLGTFLTAEEASAAFLRARSAFAAQRESLPA